MITTEQAARAAMLLLLPFSFALVIIGQGGPSGEAAWLRDFMTWAASLPADVAPASVDPMYKEHLASQGLSPTAIEQRWSSVERQRRDNEDWLRMSTNRYYSHG